MEGLLALGGADEGRILRQIIEATPNAMIMVDQRGRITLVNSQAESQFGYSRDAAVGDDSRPAHSRAVQGSSRGIPWRLLQAA